MFQPNEGLEDALHGDQGRGGRMSALGSFRILTTDMFNPETILRRSFKALLVLPSSSCFLPSQSTSSNSCTMTQLQKEAEKCQNQPVTNLEEDVCVICLQSEDRVEWTLPWPWCTLLAMSHWLKGVTVTIHHSILTQSSSHCCVLGCRNNISCSNTEVRSGEPHQHPPSWTLPRPGAGQAVPQILPSCFLGTLHPTYLFFSP